MGARKAVKGTNIRVESLGADVHTAGLVHAVRRGATGPGVDACVARLVKARSALAELPADDDVELSWIDRLRPRRALIAPAEAFAQTVKRLMPAVDFNTYDEEMAKSRRAERRERQEEVTKARRAADMVPSVGLKTALDPRKLAKDNGMAELPEEKEVFDMLSGKTKFKRMQLDAKAKRARKAINRAGKSYTDAAAFRKAKEARGAAVDKAPKRDKRPQTKTKRAYIGDGL